MKEKSGRLRVKKKMVLALFYVVAIPPVIPVKPGTDIKSVHFRLQK